MKSLSKSLVVVLALLFVVSSVASAINISSATVTLRGQNVWTKGKITGTPLNTDDRVIIFTSSGTGWTARAEFAGATVGISKWNFQTEEGPFKLNLWGRGHSLSNYQTPFVWVQDAAAANASNWKARMTFKILDGETVFTIDNATGNYFLFYKKVFGDTTLGTAYRTNFKHATASSVYAITKVPGVTITGEVAADGVWDAAKEGTKLQPKYGLQGVFDFGLTLKGTYLTQAKQLTVEATQLMTDKLSRYYGKYYDNNGTKQVVGEVTFRAKNDQDITRTFTTNDTWYNIANTGSNYWLVTTGWAAGATVTRNINTSLVLKLNGFYEFVPGKVKALATLDWNKADTAAEATWTLNVRGFYKVNDKFTVHPRLTVDKTWVKAGTYVDYVINRGRIVGAAFYDINRSDETKNQERIELGWSIGL